jgi:hypothetical protein
MAENNNNGGNGNKNIMTIAQLASTGVLILGMFGLWWQSADPKTRLDKIETTQVDNRKELNEVITSLRKDFSSNYVSLREHNDLISRLKTEVESLDKADGQFMTKTQFDTWNHERNRFVDEELKRLRGIEDEINVVRKETIPREEADAKWLSQSKLNEDLNHRIEDRVSRFTADEVWKNNTSRLDKIYQLYEVLQAQINDLQKLRGNSK